MARYYTNFPPLDDNFKVGDVISTPRVIWSSSEDAIKNLQHKSHKVAEIEVHPNDIRTSRTAIVAVKYTVKRIIDQQPTMPKRTTLFEYLTEPLPETYNNYENIPQKVEWPKDANLIARCGDVYMFKGKHLYTVIYGLDVIETPVSNFVQASADFGNCCIHQAQCHGLTD